MWTSNLQQLNVSTQPSSQQSLGDGPLWVSNKTKEVTFPDRPRPLDQELGACCPQPSRESDGRISYSLHWGKLRSRQSSSQRRKARSVHVPGQHGFRSATRLRRLTNTLFSATDALPEQKLLHLSRPTTLTQPSSPTSSLTTSPRSHH